MAKYQQDGRFAPVRVSAISRGKLGRINGYSYEGNQPISTTSRIRNSPLFLVMHSVLAFDFDSLLSFPSIAPSTSFRFRFPILLSPLRSAQYQLSISIHPSPLSVMLHAAVDFDFDSLCSSFPSVAPRTSFRYQFTTLPSFYCCAQYQLSISIHSSPLFLVLPPVPSFDFDSLFPSFPSVAPIARFRFRFTVLSFSQFCAQRQISISPLFSSLFLALRPALDFDVDSLCSPFPSVAPRTRFRLTLIHYPPLFLVLRPELDSDFDSPLSPFPSVEPRTRFQFRFTIRLLSSCRTQHQISIPIHHYPLFRVPISIHYPPVVLALQPVPAFDSDSPGSSSPSVAPTTSFRFRFTFLLFSLRCTQSYISISIHFSSLFQVLNPEPAFDFDSVRTSFPSVAPRTSFRFRFTIFLSSCCAQRQISISIHSSPPFLVLGPVLASDFNSPFSSFPSLAPSTIFRFRFTLLLFSQCRIQDQISIPIHSSPQVPDFQFRTKYQISISTYGLLFYSPYCRSTKTPLSTL